MDLVLFIVGIFFLWKGQMQVSKKSQPWPLLKRNGRIIGGVLILPMVAEGVYILFLLAY
ncbi:MAG: hypothetical protein UW27_C0001G0030 [Parcubacteria group bacterium GW2011_GWA1_44_13]|uniref:Uncharacterized protein n=1 Tax=Candidatus Nomurabacteria bacterium GW2011_GWB1_44_12 TaxID=1618748 RepID=A0A837IB26_9BACT|nr:MAG: hypothetical protein UW17_C0035G0006 [Candidatus Nomurabacteria bacterium GW2011_GWD1_44_10]KKT37223.1 MAG: hypothetical protein UW25_C0001G0031 [Candidatus Nomurabacteria bacterium GW2011_GWB1_44_12]KKT38534.1 MAG: hypothetical protein UW27_C0001G0030 [Parcubacteria group bacterium GW2011_GWA1_44_13]KKT60934.1 MAG: hypothetical protein UW54_C0001G0015 [Parcubacteria group bacterium GW2011_GWC1_44_26]